MGSLLDIDDVCADHPKAMAELERLRKIEAACEVLFMGGFRYESADDVNNGYWEWTGADEDGCQRALDEIDAYRRIEGEAGAEEEREDATA